jgi:F-type H+-transporting ATPase subunit gamma
MASGRLFNLSTVLGKQGVRCFTTTPQQNATLKDVRIQLKSITNIQKITKTMQMVSAAKYAKAERELKPARVYGTGAAALGEKAELEADQSKPNHLIVAISSDRGLCGGVHSGVAKAIKANLQESTNDTKLVICGEKAKSILMRTHAPNILFAMSELGRKPPMFEEASFIAEQILTSGYEFDVCKMYYNKFKSVVSYELTPQDIFSLETLCTAETMMQYDDTDEDVLRNYHEFSTANLIFFGMKESACSEQSARMTAMDNATKNAGDMIQRLQIVYNRTRQAVITTELIEIISGCVALETAD